MNRPAGMQEVNVNVDGVEHQGHFIVRDDKVHVFFAGTAYGEAPCADHIGDEDIARDILHAEIRQRLAQHSIQRKELHRRPMNREKSLSQATPDVVGGTSLRDGVMFRQLKVSSSNGAEAFCRYCKANRSLEMSRISGRVKVHCLSCDTEEELDGLALVG